MPGESLLRIAASASDSGTFQSVNSLTGLFNWRYLNSNDYLGGTRPLAVALSSPGSVTNMEDLIHGRVEMALVRADIAEAMYDSPNKFELSAQVSRLRMVSTHKPVMLHVLVRADFQADSLKVLYNSKISLAAAGSYTDYGLKSLFQLHQAPFGEMLIHRIPLTESIHRIESGKLDALIYFDQAPSSAVAELLNNKKLKLISLDAALLAQYRERNPATYFQPVNTSDYYNSTENILSVQVGTYLLSTSRVDSLTVDSIIETLNVTNTDTLESQGQGVDEPIRKRMLTTAYITGTSLSAIPPHRGTQLYQEIFIDQTSTSPSVTDDSAPDEALATQEK